MAFWAILQVIVHIKADRAGRARGPTDHQLRSANSIVAESKELQPNRERMEPSKTRVAELHKQLQDAERKWLWLSQQEQCIESHALNSSKMSN